MVNQFSRTQLMLGKEAMRTLKKSHIAVFGVGGVGGYVVEVLARSGVGAIDIIDKDVVSISNINRQLAATLSTIGKAKVEVAAEHIKDINPDCRVRAYKVFYLPENADEFDLSQYDYVADCVDNVSAKIELIQHCIQASVPLICSMGAGNKLDPMGFKVADINQTSMDPLARTIRKKLRELGIRHQKVVFSTEKPRQIIAEEEAVEGQMTRVPASNAFVPAAAGLLIGGQIIKELVGLSK